MSLISITEKQFITLGIQSDLRADGRQQFDYRPITLETSIIAQSSGSCRCTLASTDILVDVKVEVGTVDINNQQSKSFDHGKIICTVDCAPSAYGLLDYKGVDAVITKCSTFLNRLLNGPHSGIDLAALCIIPGASYWVLNVNILVLDYSGNMYDAILIAIKGAVHNTRIPLCTIEQVGGKYEFDIADEETERISGVENMPLCITLNKIGNRHVVDCSLLEESCVDAKIIVAINPKGNLCSIMKDGRGSIEPSLLADMLLVKELSMSMFGEITKLLGEEEERVEGGQASIGFL